jgi:hypothetical protein
VVEPAAVELAAPPDEAPAAVAAEGVAVEPEAVLPAVVRDEVIAVIDPFAEINNALTSLGCGVVQPRLDPDQDRIRLDGFLANQGQVTDLAIRLGEVQRLYPVDFDALQIVGDSFCSLFEILADPAFDAGPAQQFDLLSPRIPGARVQRVGYLDGINWPLANDGPPAFLYVDWIHVDLVVHDRAGVRISAGEPIPINALNWTDPPREEPLILLVMLSTRPLIQTARPLQEEPTEYFRVLLANISKIREEGTDLSVRYLYQVFMLVPSTPR